MSSAELARRLRELIAALDRRRPYGKEAPESAIAKDATQLREKAVTRLAAAAVSAPLGSKTTTPFPATPAEVAILTIQEFTFDLDEFEGARAPSMERVCRTFMDDANRALVWWIRFGALRAWCGHHDALARSGPGSRSLRDACELAASFPLNQCWEFDAATFGRAVSGAAVTRSGSDR